MKRISLLSIIFLLILGLSMAYSQTDPFADLGGGEEDSLEVPDGSSSIRAKRKAKKDAFVGEVIKVRKKTKTFPYVEFVKIKIIKQAKVKNDLQKQLEVGKVYKFVIDYKMKDGKFDYTDKNNQKNIGAYFFEKGDKVMGKAIEKLKGKQFKVEYLQRK